ncbi:MAG: hypothetical protein NVS3B1_12760 [Marmoricola sp.]
MSHTSLCVLSYNRPQFLPNCIESLHASASPEHPIELIVHDDGSSDPALLKYLYTAHQQGKISTLILNSPGHNEGQGVALNRMFAIATGDPIVKIDHDLTFKPHWLAEAHRILEVGREEVGLLGLFKYHHEPVNWRETLVRPEAEDYGLHTHICGSAMVIPRYVYEALGPFEQRSDAFAEDAAFQHKVSAQDGLWCALPTEDLVENHGFGVGPSTVVVAADTVATIHHGPRIYGP